MAWKEMGSLAMVRARRRARVAFVLSGGGPYGAIQAGMIEALTERGIVPDLIVGTSVGAINGILFAKNPTLEGAGRLREIWLQLKREDMFPGSRLTTAWNVLRRGNCMFPNTGLRRLIEGEGIGDFEDLAIPVHINATDLDTGEESWFSKGPAVDPLLASCAMPGVFPPIVIDGATYIDGGVANNVPVSRAVELGARQIYVFNVNAAAQKRELSRPHDYVMYGLVLARAQRYRREIERVSRQVRVYEMPVVDVGYVPLLDNSKAERMMEAGKAAAEAFLDARDRKKSRPAAEIPSATAG